MAELKNAVQPAGWHAALPRAQFALFEKIDVQNDWYDVYRLPQNVFAICELHHFQEVISFLILGKESALLLDTGLGMNNFAAAVRRLTDLPIVVVNSHTHFDHIGGNAQFPLVHVLENPHAVQVLSKGISAQELKPELVEGSVVYGKELGFDPARYAIAPCTFTTVPPGHVFSLGGRNLKVLATPGHAEDALMLADDANKILFTGDTFYPATLYAHLTDCDVRQTLEVYRRTLEKLAGEYAQYTLYCSHNEPLREGGMLCEAQRAFGEILGGTKPYLTDEAGLKKYEFNGFAVVTN